MTRITSRTLRVETPSERRQLPRLSAAPSDAAELLSLSADADAAAADDAAASDDSARDDADELPLRRDDAAAAAPLIEPMSAAAPRRHDAEPSAADAADEPRAPFILRRRRRAMPSEPMPPTFTPRDAHICLIFMPTRRRRRREPMSAERLLFV